MVIKKIVFVCPECEHTVYCGMDNAEFSMVESKVAVSVECPECGALLEDETLEIE